MANANKLLDLPTNTYIQLPDGKAFRKMTPAEQLSVEKRFEAAAMGFRGSWIQESHGKPTLSRDGLPFIFEPTGVIQQIASSITHDQPSTSYKLKCRGVLE